LIGVATASVLLAVCSTDGQLGEPAPTTAARSTSAARSTDARASVAEPATAYTYPPGPIVADFATPDATEIFEQIVGDISVDAPVTRRLDELVAAGDARHAWLISDLLRFAADPDALAPLTDAFIELTGVNPAADPTFMESPWKSITDHLIAWDLPAPPNYRELKARLFTLVEPKWAPFFADADAAIDWRWVSWGGVLIDDRPLGATDRCERGCIPALDDPALTDADEGDWYPDEAIVFGIVEGGHAVALPKHIMEVHEMVNMTIGGRRFAIPYCTLCGSAEAFYTDRISGVDEPLVLRTSGLLSRSNKVMYDLTTKSVFDTFTGAAVSGPLQDAAVELQLVTTTVATWGDWKAAHPNTRIIAEDGGIGRSYPPDPLGGRDDDGPIFPTGDIDPRLDAHDPVIGVLTADGTAVAFPTDAATAALANGQTVTAAGVEVYSDGAGLRTRTPDGSDLASHQAFWFAWSQFHPDTILWEPP
jgi:hypothetical protein